nr:uncharacterized protein LOC127321473 [Lolium perenne]
MLSFVEADGQKKSGRGVLKGLKVSKKRFASGSAKLNVAFSDRLGGSTGMNYRSFVDDVVVFMKRRMPLIGVRTWADIHASVHRLIVADVLERWNLEDTPDMEDKILKIAKERYRGWRSTLHSTYKAYNTDAARMANVPEDLQPEEWEWLINYFGTNSKFQETSQKNSDNRKKQKAIHRVGSKSYSQLSFEKRDLETGEEPDCIALWELTHTKNGIWSNRESQDVYDKACEEVNLKEGETNGPVSTEDRNNIFQTNYKTTMGCKSSQPRGYGYMAKPPRPADRFRVELEEQSRASQRQNAELNQQVTQLQDELQAERENTQQQLELERAERQRLEERLQEDRIERERLLEEERRSRQLELQAVEESFMKFFAEMTEMMGSQQTLAQQIAPRRNGKENTNPNVSRSLFQTPSTNAAPGKKNMIPPNQLAAAAKLNTRIFRAMKIHSLTIWNPEEI